jgi:hypothetical protein
MPPVQLVVLTCAGHGTQAERRRFTVVGRKNDANKARALPEMVSLEEA